jgi:hypothetical protein
MSSLPMPAPVLASLAIAAAITALELVGWLILCPRFTRLLPFRRSVPEGLPTPKGEDLRTEQRGRSEHVAWRWHPGSRALLFRRRLELGRKPYCIGRLHLDHDGRWVLQWAPFPLFAWPAAAAAWVAVLLGLGWAALPGGLLVMTIASALFLLVIGANLWLSRRAFDSLIWPEVKEQLREWLR